MVRMWGAKPRPIKTCRSLWGRGIGGYQEGYKSTPPVAARNATSYGKTRRIRPQEAAARRKQEILPGCRAVPACTTPHPQLNETARLKLPRGPPGSQRPSPPRTWPRPDGSGPRTGWECYRNLRDEHGRLSRLTTAKTRRIRANRQPTHPSRDGNGPASPATGSSAYKMTTP